MWLKFTLITVNLSLDALGQICYQSGKFIPIDLQLGSIPAALTVAGNRAYLQPNNIDL